MYDLYIAACCQGKELSHRSEKEEESYPSKVNEALTNDPMVLARVFHRECQYAKRMSALSIYRDWLQ